MKPIRALVATALLAAAAHAAPLKTDAAHSSVSAVFKQMNVPVEAKFKTFTAQIDYDAAKPEASKAAVDIATATRSTQRQPRQAAASRSATTIRAHAPRRRPRAASVLSPPARRPTRCRRASPAPASPTCCSIPARRSTSTAAR